MDTPIAALLFVAGIGGGVVTALVGGASVITFPALLAAGIPPIIATASNSVATTPGNVMAVLADISRIPCWDKSFVSLAALFVIGSALGAYLLLITPEAAFAACVPVLIGTATILFALAGPIRRRLDARVASEKALGQKSGRAVLWFAAPLAIYGGYFGAGMSVMLLALLAIDRPADYRTMNVTKNIFSALISSVAVAIFIARGLVAWPQTLVMMAGAICGGYAGGWLTRILSETIVRAFVVAAGTAFTVIYAWRYWGVRAAAV